MIEFALVYMIGTIIINQDQTFPNVNDCLFFASGLTDHQKFHTQMARLGRLPPNVKPCPNGRQIGSKYWYSS